MVYELDPLPLLKSLHAQTSQLNIEWEFLVYDDGSTKELQERNRSKIEAIEKVRYIAGRENLGRAKARNFLVQKCSGDFVLMLDGDLSINRPDFLAKYWQNRLENGVCIGGKEVAESRPIKGSELRWHYAKKREAKSVLEREKNPFQGFQTTCYISDISVFSEVKFNENLIGYGHEDSLFGLNLKSADFDIKHINNPVLYHATEASDIFLQKTDEALQNLLRIASKYPQYQSYFPLLRLKSKMKAWNSIILIVEPILTPMLKYGLLGHYPSLSSFDLYRFLRLLKLDRANKFN